MVMLKRIQRLWYAKAETIQEWLKHIKIDTLGIKTYFLVQYTTNIINNDQICSRIQYITSNPSKNKFKIALFHIKIFILLSTRR